MNGFVLTILPLISIIVFLAGMIYRFRIWTKGPSPSMTLFPAPAKDSNKLLSLFKESFFFPGLFKGDKYLWIISWVFHATLAMIIIGHIRVFTDFPALWAALGINADTMSAVSGGIAGVIILITAILLLVRRFTTQRVREISDFSDFFALLLVIAILITGNVMRFGEHFDLEITRTYFSQLFSFSFIGMTLPQNGMFTFHFFLVQLLLMYIPFSKILHFGGIFFTHAAIQKH